MSSVSFSFLLEYFFKDKANKKNKKKYVSSNMSALHFDYQICT